MSKCSRLLILVLLGLLPLPIAACQEPTVTTARATQVDELVVGSWNLLNLFDNHDNPWRPDEGTSPKSWVELKHLARQIDKLGVDILGVQEVENREILETLNGYLERPFAHVELLEGNDFRGIDVGILSRVPIESATSHRHMMLEGDHLFARDFPLFRLNLGGDRRLDVGVVHLKSKRGKKTTSDAWRRAEAMGIAKILKARAKLEPAVPVLVMGDFNDYRDADTIAPLHQLLVDVTAAIPDDERYTFVHDQKGEQIDFILASPGFEASRARIEHDIDRVSDHFPVVARFPMTAKVPRTELPAGTGPKELDRPVVAATDLKLLSTLLLKEIVVEGKVTKVYRPENRAFATLNFHEDYRKACSVHVPPSVLASMGDLDALVGKKVRIAGPLSLYKGAPQVVWTRREQRLN